MDINITARNTDIDDKIKKYIVKKLSKLEKMYYRVICADVVVVEEKSNKNVELIVSLKRNKVIAKESAPDIYSSIDQSVDCVKKQLRRISGRVKSRRRKFVLNNFMRTAASDDTGDDLVSDSAQATTKGEILKSNAFADKPMSPEDAKMQLDGDGKDFMMFKSVYTGESNVIYKKNDGNYGLIEPKF